MIGLAEFQISTLLLPSSARQSYARRLSASKSDESRKQTLNPSLEDLVSGLDVRSRKGGGESRVTCLITDSRRVVPGALFFAIGGLRTDGNYFIEEAVDRGAVAIITEQDLGQRFPIPYLQVEDARSALAEISRVFYGEPDKSLNIAGITGTNGKTTVSMLTQHLLGGSDRVGLLGTVRYDLGRRTLPSFRTTPESVDIYALLSQMVVNNCRDVVMEISSHGIDQKRVHGLGVEVAAFLNLSQDHIDYHQSMEAYYEVKRRLFTGEVGAAPQKRVINVDCPYGRRLCGELSEEGQTITFGFAEDADLRAENVVLRADGTSFDLVWDGQCESVQIPILGRYNVSNVLAALAICRAQGHQIENLLPMLGAFPGVSGRMERINLGQPFNVLVDYAHTDDALSNACGMLNEITEGRLIVVFGCGGNRDRGKRAPMLQAALNNADLVVATSDNPRAESLEQIFDDMQIGIGEEAQRTVRFIRDRRDAISEAFDLAQPGDCVLIAGKGHETFQEYDGTIIPFDDRDVARELIRLKGDDAIL
ncbi:MAG: UDP-N-acetylmuramoyl-L-alanyl-D-glutamate--2,6-diaminopimelate ligase [Verrucomicrobiota bacterium]